ncbi:unnamed protein product [Closterium sp. Naga37s-1]|nr:unnamed protein product [Closterium sp. Naga37s-1]
MAIGARRAFASSARRLVSARLASPFAPRFPTSTSPLDAAPNRHPLPSAVQTHADGAVSPSVCRAYSAGGEAQGSAGSGAWAQAGGVEGKTVGEGGERSGSATTHFGRQLPLPPRRLRCSLPCPAMPPTHSPVSVPLTSCDPPVRIPHCAWRGVAGYRAVREEEKAELVGGVFSSVADKYDVMNDVMSGGLHRLWKDRCATCPAVTLVPAHPCLSLPTALTLPTVPPSSHRPSDALRPLPHVCSRLVRALHPFPHMRHLDVAGGTGDIAFRVLRAIREAEADPRRMAAAAGTGRSSGEGSGEAVRGARVIVCDINADMLRVGQLRAQQQGVATRRPTTRTPPAFACVSAQITPPSSSCARVPPCHPLPAPNILCLWASPIFSTPQPPPVFPGLASDAALEWVQGDAEDMSAVLADGSVDAYSIAFGIRNVTRIHRALAEAHRVLRKGGQFACLELSHVEDPLFRALYDTYSFNVIPAIGQAVTGDRASYQYLVESIRKFPTQRRFAHMMEQAGFRNVSYENMTGGVVALFTGFKL